MEGGVATSKKKSGFFGKLITGVLVLGALAIILVLAAPYFINWKDAKDKATAYLSKTLHHKVTIESISVGLFEGVTLNKVSISNGTGFSSQPLFYNETAVLRPSLLSLFLGKIVISKIEFKNPTLLIEKNAKGVFNFSDMAGSSKAPAKGSQPSDSSSSSLNVLVNTFDLSGGDLTYKDHAAGKTTAIKGLDILLTGFSLEAGGKSHLEIHMTADLEGKAIPLSLATDFGLDLNSQTVTLASLTLKAPSLSLGASGQIANFKGDPDLDIQAKAVAKLDSIIADLAPPSALKGLPSDLKASGSITLDAALKGKLSQAENFGMKVTLAFDKVGVQTAQIPALDGMSGTLSIGPNSAQLPDLHFNLGGSPVALDLEASNYSIKNLRGPQKDLRLNLKYALTSPKLVMEPLMAYASIPDSPEVLQQQAAENARDHGIKDYRLKVPKGVTINGSIKVDAVQYKQILTGEFSHVVELKQQRLKSTLNWKLFGGTAFNQLEADLSVPGPKHTFHVVVSKVQFDKAVDEAAASFPDKAFLQQIKGKLFGSFSLELQGHGKGSQAPALNKNLVLDGDFSMLDGVLKKLDLSEKLAAAIPYPATQDILRKDINFGEMAGKVSLKNEKLTLSDFFLGSGADHRQGEIYVQASGTQVMGGALDYKIVPHFNPRAVALQGPAADAFNDDQGWPTFDYVEYKGPNSASAKADYSAGAKKAATKAAQKQVQQLIQNQGQGLIKQLPGGLQNLFGH
jgi:uncharacterized protein involved in outer membrane biogenesis